jgi:hypothetical protein
MVARPRATAVRPSSRCGCVRGLLMLDTGGGPLGHPKVFINLVSGFMLCIDPLLIRLQDQPGPRPCRYILTHSTSQAPRTDSLTATAASASSRSRTRTRASYVPRQSDPFAASTQLHLYTIRGRQRASKYNVHAGTGRGARSERLVYGQPERRDTTGEAAHPKRGKRAPRARPQNRTERETDPKNERDARPAVQQAVSRRASAINNG